MRDEQVEKYSGVLQKTPGEKWNVGARILHWYGASTDFAIEHLGLGNGRTCLVIGSPIFEAIALRKNGWETLYMDIRKPPDEAGKFIVMDATENTLADESFDAVSTACVLTHAGTGRYGDGMKEEHGDEIMLSHIARVMKPGARAAITFGAVADMPKMVRLGTAHRVYTIAECRRMLSETVLKIDGMRIWSHVTKHWLNDGEPMATGTKSPDYISFGVTKAEGVAQP